MKHTILLAVIISFLTSALPAHASVKTYGDGYIETVEGIPVLHVKGSEYEMGKQYGFLAGDLVAAQVENLKKIGEIQEPRLKLMPDSFFSKLRRVVGWVFWLTYPRNIKDHIKGMVEGGAEAGTPLNKYDIAFINAVIDIVGIANANISQLPSFAGERDEKAPTKNSMILRILGLSGYGQQCDSFAAWGSRTVDGKTFQTRNTDMTTGQGLERFPLVVLYKPDGKIPFLTAAFSGMVGAFTGMNAYGVALGQVWAFSKDVKLDTPWHLVMRKFLSEETTAKGVVGRMAKKNTTTYGNNFIVADAGNIADPTDTGFAVEMTGKNFQSFKANDERELLSKYNGESVANPIPDAVFRGDVSFDLKIRSKQLSGDGPDGDPRETGSYKDRYKGQYDRIIAYEKAGIKISHVEAEAISSETAMKNSSLQTAVYANTDRDFWVSYAKMNEDGSVTQAFEQKYINIPFHAYLVTLHESNGVVSLENLFKERKNLKLRYLSKSKGVIDTVLDLNASDKLQTGLTMARGETVELYDGDKLIDRLQRY